MDIYSIIVSTASFSYHGSYDSLEKSEEKIIEIINNQIYIDSAKYFVEKSTLNTDIVSHIYEWRDGNLVLDFTV